MPSEIEWTDETWNPVIGCTPVSPGCLNCYAARVAERLQTMPRMSQYVGLTVRHKGSHKAAGPVDESRMMAAGKVSRPVFNGTVRCLPHKLDEPLHWRTPRRVFVNSMSDLFHEAVPKEFIVKVFAVMAACCHHTFQVLTKRPDIAAAVLAEPEFWLAVAARTYAICEDGNVGLTPAQATMIADGRGLPLPNVWLGASIENDDYHARAWELLKCPAAVRFLSLEPLIGPVDLNRWELLCKAWVDKRPTIGTYIDWVIVGGESGPRSRPCDVAWIRSIVKQCQDAGVPCFVKQLGAQPVFGVHADGAACVGKWYEPTIGDDFDTRHVNDHKGGDPSEWPADLRVRQFPEVTR